MFGKNMTMALLGRTTPSWIFFDCVIAGHEETM
jgi:hypothetical protein